MIYCCSDIHGRYDRYMKAVEKLSPDDKLYVLGDAIDRHEGGIAILQDIMKRDNVELILGNHEYMFINVMFMLSLCDSEEMLFKSKDFLVWVDERNGGRVTYNALTELELNELNDLANWVLNCKLFKRLSIDGQVFYLGHASALKEYKGVESLTLNDVISSGCSDNLFNLFWLSPFDVKHRSEIDNYLENELYILGHRPVQNFKTTEFVSIRKWIYDIDGGCAGSNNGDNSLILLCLDTMEPEYIK